MYRGIKIKGRIYLDTFCSLVNFFSAVYFTYVLHVPLIQLSLTVNIATAGFFALLASLPFIERNKFIRLS